MIHLKTISYSTAREVKMATGENELAQMSCEDFGEFKEALKVLRLIDDKIIYKLNKSIPTDSFVGQIDAEQKCQELYNELLSGYKTRDQAIKKCITLVSENAKQLRERNEKNPDDFQIMKDLRKEQTKLRLMQSELSVEEVIQRRTVKAFNERCWKYFKPSQ